MIVDIVYAVISAHSSLQSTSGLPRDVRNALVLEKGRLPKKPVRAEKGEG